MKTITSLAIWGAGGRGGGASIIRLGPYWFTYTVSFYINLHVKYGSNLIRTFWDPGGGGGFMSNPGILGLPKCQKMQISSQWRHMHKKRKQLTTSFSYIGQNVNKLNIFGYGGGGSNEKTGPILLSSYPLTHIYVHVK